MVLLGSLCGATLRSRTAGRGARPREAAPGQSPARPRAAASLWGCPRGSWPAHAGRERASQGLLTTLGTVCGEGGVSPAGLHLQAHTRRASPPRPTRALGRAHSRQHGGLPTGPRGHSWGQGRGRHAGDLREVQEGLGAPSAPADLAAPAGGKGKEGQTQPGTPAPALHPTQPPTPGISAAPGA